MKPSHVVISFLTAVFSSEAKFTVLMYTDSSFDNYVGQVQFEANDQCYPLCIDTKAVAAFVWDGEPQGMELVVFEDVECQGEATAGGKKTDAEFSTVASAHKIRSLMVSTGPQTPANDIVHSCESDMMYKPFNNSAVVM
ncbi:hypothetical protein P3T76_014057 [Phytophthora citrophthora]|uniref:Uncharacterized protein n=1 Tax=Phytophthora citrophthora TaxID=4793 RepID=A0AAD9G250_9STRA|nr:hypothetical protein P3T76_014057 [Phytophthora citrophthora]